MALAEPQITETWRGSYNNLAAFAATIVYHRTVMLDIKDTLINNSPQVAWDTVPAGIWTTGYSCDGSVAGVVDDGVDRWGVITDLTWDQEGDNHSWYVFKASGTREVLINLNNNEEAAANATTEQCTIYISSSAGFTGGSITARPTATDEYQICSQDGSGVDRIQGGHWFGAQNSTNGLDSRYTILMSDDGTEVRMTQHRGASVNFGFWGLGYLVGGPAAQTDNSWGFVWSVSQNTPIEAGGLTSTLNSMLLVTALNARWMCGELGNVGFARADFHESSSTGSNISLWSQNDFGGSGNQQDGTQIVSPIGLWNSDSGGGDKKGFMGLVKDMWITSDNRNNGDTFAPAPDIDDRRFCKIGENYVIAWQPDAASGGADPGIKPQFFA